jgi:hypothetical protein
MTAVTEMTLDLEPYVAPPREAPTRPLRLDNCMPAWDATRVERRVIDATPERLFDVTLNTNFLDAVRGSRAVRILFASRAIAERVITKLRSRPRPRSFSPAAMRVGALPLRGEWVTLGQDWPREIVFGAIGRFRAGETQWLKTDASVYRSFDADGFAKIACHIWFRSLGNCQTLVIYESRTKATDPASRRAFLRYWRVVSPFVGVVMRAMLATIERNAMRG